MLPRPALVGLAAARSGVLVALVVAAHLAAGGSCPPGSAVWAGVGLACAVFVAEFDALRHATGRTSGRGALALRLLLLQLAGHAVLAVTGGQAAGRAMAMPGPSPLLDVRMLPAHLAAAALAAWWLCRGESWAFAVAHGLARPHHQLRPRPLAPPTLYRPRSGGAPRSRSPRARLFARPASRRGPPALPAPLGV